MPKLKPEHKYYSTFSTKHLNNIINQEISTLSLSIQKNISNTKTTNIHQTTTYHKS
jgi:hypothetical protein